MRSRTDSSQWSEHADGDGYGDNSLGNNSDAFPLRPLPNGPTLDGDGYGDTCIGNSYPDAYPTDASANGSTLMVMATATTRPVPTAINSRTMRLSGADARRRWLW